MAVLSKSEGVMWTVTAKDSGRTYNDNKAEMWLSNPMIGRKIFSSVVEKHRGLGFFFFPHSGIPFSVFEICSFFSLKSREDSLFHVFFFCFKSCLITKVICSLNHLIAWKMWNSDSSRRQTCCKCGGDFSINMCAYAETHWGANASLSHIPTYQLPACSQLCSVNAHTHACAHIATECMHVLLCVFTKNQVRQPLFSPLFNNSRSTRWQTHKTDPHGNVRCISCWISTLTVFPETVKGLWIMNGWTLTWDRVLNHKQTAQKHIQAPVNSCPPPWLPTVE